MIDLAAAILFAFILIGIGMWAAVSEQSSKAEPESTTMQGETDDRT